MRIDKWLWAARFFKTRSLAQRACELGRVQVSGHTVKPAHEVRAGDQLRITTEGGVYEVKVMGLSEVRGPASAAQALYQESPASRDAREQAVAERKALGFAGSAGGRPSKRDRWRIVRFRQGGD